MTATNTRISRYREARRKHLDQLGGQYCSPHVADRCERTIQAEEPVLDFERARAVYIRDTRPWNPF